MKRDIQGKIASLFKRATGLSPHQYVIKQRVKRVKLLLLTVVQGPSVGLLD
jgi:transcriptional regulator GlxA family with amidase domain